ncbi:hypothetical protein PybrP1_012525, partial [[Pythium] brassicae (nom. inval.)]
MLSDVLRTGLGIKTQLNRRLEPDRSVLFGPLAYSMGHFVRSETAGNIASIWGYKFDTTSIGLRAYAEFFQLASWP